MEEDGPVPFEFSSGEIGSISVNPGWTGVDVLLTDIAFTLSFSASKAMQWALQPQEEEEYVGMANGNAQQPPTMPHPMPLGPKIVPRYCNRHGSSEMRTKIAPRWLSCSSCHKRLQTNYSEFSLCPLCSDRDCRCMLCGNEATQFSAEDSAARPFQIPQQVQTRDPGSESGNVLQNHAPRYCSEHKGSERRVKGLLQLKACQACSAQIRTSYRDFSLCPACSETKCRCVICGASVFDIPPPPPPVRAAATRSVSSGADPASCSRGIGQSLRARVPGPPPPFSPGSPNAPSRTWNGQACGKAAESLLVDPQAGEGRTMMSSSPRTNFDLNQQGMRPPFNLSPGGWREGTRKASQHQVGCGIPCGVDDGGFTGIFDSLDPRTWMPRQINSSSVQADNRRSLGALGPGITRPVG